MSARREESPSLLRANAGAASVAAAAAWWLLEVTRSWAGRDAPSVTVGAVLVAVAVLLTRPDRALPRVAIVLAAAISIGAFVVPVTADTGWAGAPEAAVYASGAWLAVAVAGLVVTRPDATALLLTILVASAVVEFASGWTAWWGGKDPSRPMIGTFYWHNPYAAFLVPGGLLGLAFWIWRTRVFALLGLISFTFASVGVWYSTSRAGLATFVLGVVLVGLTAAVDAERWRSLRQLGLALVVAVGTTFLVAGPPFFPHRASPLAAEQARAATQPLGQNTGQRVDFWREALTVFRHHPVTGGGFKSLVAQSDGHVPASWPLSPYAHNGYLQALGEGGLVLGLPFLLAVLAVAFFTLRALARGIIRRQLPPEQVVVAIALGCVMVHSGVDFDWAYAASFGLASVLAGMVVGLALRDRPGAGPGRPGRTQKALIAVCVVAGIGLLGVSAWVMRHGDHRENLPVSTAAPR